jgi:hypothetical protein
MISVEGDIYAMFWNALACLLEFVKNSWQYAEPLVAIATFAGVTRLVLSIQSRLTGVWEGELTNSDTYRLKATISIYKMDGDTHSWIFYNGTGHDGERTQGVDKTIQFSDSFAASDDKSPDQGAPSISRFWKPKRYVLNCQREMFGQEQQKFTIDNMKKQYTYEFTINPAIRRKLKCAIYFKDKAGIDITLQGRFVKVR